MRDLINSWAQLQCLQVTSAGGYTIFSHTFLFLSLLSSFHLCFSIPTTRTLSSKIITYGNDTIIVAFMRRYVGAIRKAMSKASENVRARQQLDGYSP
jgi:hypothetical protein